MRTWGCVGGAPVGAESENMGVCVGGGVGRGRK